MRSSLGVFPIDLAASTAAENLILHWVDSLNEGPELEVSTHPWFKYYLVKKIRHLLVLDRSLLGKFLVLVDDIDHFLSCHAVREVISYFVLCKHQLTVAENRLIPRFAWMLRLGLGHAWVLVVCLFLALSILFALGYCVILALSSTKSKYIAQAHAAQELSLYLVTDDLETGSNDSKTYT